MMDDRRVHAADTRGEVVRYERAGKWYYEPASPDEKRVRMRVSLAAEVATYAVKYGDGEIHFGLPGGSTFDRLVRARQARR